MQHSPHRQRILRMTPVIILSLFLSLTDLVCSMPQGLVIQSSTPVSPSSTPVPSTTTTDLRDREIQAPEISRFHVTSRIQFRYARTAIESQIRNPDIAAQLADFAVVIPESAFISNFSMVVEDEEFVARVEEKEKAEKTFQTAVSSGRGAGLVTQDVRDSNRFTVSANVEPGREIVFRLTYDELLDRKAGMYEQTINIDLKKVVEDFKVEILINESLPITTINVPELLESNEIDFEKKAENSIAVVERKVDGDDRNARIVFVPNREDQEAAEDQRVSGKLVIRYDVDRQGQDSEVQVIDGYFVHYFVPQNLKTLSKHVIFILDTSGSMAGEKIQQLKDSMFTVLNDMKPTDSFNIITFSSDVKHWTSSENASSTGQDAVSATKENKEAAIRYVLDLEATGGTNINSALLAGLQVSRDVATLETLPQGVASMIVFLSDGEATEGEQSGDIIKTNVAQDNFHLKLPIFSVAFGSGADFQLLKDISQATDSYAKLVYEDSDAALQLENFYSEISSPLVTNLRFDYVGELVDNSSVSDTEVRTFFEGGQYVVVGKLQEAEGGGLEVRVTGDISDGRYSDSIGICLRDTTGQEDVLQSVHAIDPLHTVCPPPSPLPQRTQAQQFMQSLHAFLNIQQLLKKDQKNEALALALENNFVTPLTSLVVVRPGEEDSLPAAIGEEFPLEFLSYYYDYSSSAIAFSYDTYEESEVDHEVWTVVATSAPIITTPRTFSLTNTTLTTIINNTTSITSDPLPQSPSCSLTLYSSTYHRGEQLTVQDDTSDLSDLDDRAVSATIEGSCCWLLYPDPAFSGESYRLSPGGDYRTTNSFGRNLFLEVSSVRRVVCTT